ncbi:MAG TPA: hypothetical protein VF265_03845 [Nevskiaceae bacterium]
MPVTAEAAALVEGILERVPGGAFAGQQLGRLRARVLRDLKAQLATLDGPDAPVAASCGDSGKLAARLQALLARAEVLQTPAEVEAAYFARVLDALVPDEARMLAALDDDARYPVIDVLAAPRLSVFARTVLGPVSTLAKRAGVQAPELGICYLRHLYGLGLVELMPGEQGPAEAYELLEARSDVRRVVEAARGNGHRVHVQRRALRRSAVGARLWRACGMHGG